MYPIPFESSPEYETADENGSKSRKTDLVIAYSFNFDLSWKRRDDHEGGLISPWDIHYFSHDYPDRDYRILRRFKSVKVPWSLMQKLLRNLNFFKLVQLEMERLELHCSHTMNYTLNKLKLLSVDSLKIYDDNDNLVEDSNVDIGICSNVLRTVYLGSDTISYFSFTHPEAINSLTIDRDPRRQITKFTKLTTLRCNRVEFLNIADVLELTQSGCLAHFYCNTEPLLSTSYQPTAKELKVFAELYAKLQIRSLYGGELTVYFNNVPLTLDRPLDELHLERNLINCHYYNFVTTGNPLIPCDSVTRCAYLDLLDDTFDVKSLFKHNPSNLFELYSNIRVLVLDNSAAQRKIDANPFYLFLLRCQALAELKICNAGFSAKWYDCLASRELRSLEYLNKLTLSESIGFAGCLRFEFLKRFKHLLRFSTNLATRTRMIELVREMPLLGTYGFQFWNALENSLIDVVVQKTKTMEVTIYTRKYDPDGLPDVVTQKIALLEDALVYLKDQNILFCGNWMEDLPDPK